MRMAPHVALVLLLIGVPLCLSKLPYDKLTDHIKHDCWVPDYCEPEHFRYKLCKLRLRRKGAVPSEYACPEGEYCEEIECAHKCWLPGSCWCEATGVHEGRMMCSDDGCFKHPSTQWGICRPHPKDDELPQQNDEDDEEPLLPTGFHFYTSDELLHNAKLHIDEGHHFSRPRIPKLKEEL